MPPVDGEELWKRIAQLTYRQHGGSGTNLTLTEVLDMDWHLMEWWVEWLNEQRNAEADALRRKTGGTG